MEDLNRKTNQGLPAWPKRPIEMRPSLMMPPATLPLAPSSFQVWKKPYLMTEGESSGTSKSFCKLSDVMTNLSITDNNKMSQIPFPPSDKNPISLNSVIPLTTVANKSEVVNGVQIKRGRNIDTNIDEKKLRRLISNRASAQKLRLKKAEYIASMEKKVKALEEQIVVLSPQVALYKSRHHFLLMENKSLNIKLSACIDHKKLKEVEVEDQKKEVNRLRQLHLSQQQQQQLVPTWEDGFNLLMNSNLVQSGTGQMVYSNLNQGWEPTVNSSLMESPSLQHQSVEETWMPAGWEAMVNPSLMESPSLQQNELPIMHEMENMDQTKVAFSRC